MSQPGLSALSFSVLSISMCILWPWHGLPNFFSLVLLSSFCIRLGSPLGTYYIFWIWYMPYTYYVSIHVCWMNGMLNNSLEHHECWANESMNDLKFSEWARMAGLKFFSHVVFSICIPFFLFAQLLPSSPELSAQTLSLLSNPYMSLY